MDETKHKLELDDYDKKAANVFPSAILTLVSIIQGVSFYILVDKTLLSIIGGKNQGIVIFHSILSLANIAVVAYGYIWFIGMFTGIVSIIDIYIILLLGLGEVAPMYYLNNPYMFWLLNSIFCGVAVLAFANSFYKTNKIYYDNNNVKALIKETLRFNMVWSFRGQILSFVSFGCIANSLLPKVVPIVFALITFGIILFVTNQNQHYLQKIRKICKNHNRNIEGNDGNHQSATVVDPLLS